MSLITLVSEAIEADVDYLERIDGLPALRVTHAGVESVVLVLPAKGGMAKLLEMLVELRDRRAR